MQHAGGMGFPAQQKKERGMTEAEWEAKRQQRRENETYFIEKVIGWMGAIGCAYIVIEWIVRVSQ